MNKNKIHAAFKTPEGDLALAMPSSSSHGNYIVLVRREKELLKVAHRCPAASKGRSCWHLSAAIKEARFFFGIRNFEARAFVSSITLHAEWEQIEIPSQISIHEEAKEDRLYASG